MKIICLLMLISFFSCKNGETVKSEEKKPIEKSTKNKLTEIKFRNAKNTEIVRNDTLLNHFNFKNLKELKCETKFLDKDYEDENYFIREYEIKISDTLLISALERQGKSKTIDYVYLYNGKTFNIRNYYGRMFYRESNLFFHFDTRQAYRISKNKLLLREQPATWCGKANQMDFFQIVDLMKMEITQFVDYDTIVK